MQKITRLLHLITLSIAVSIATWFTKMVKKNIYFSNLSEIRSIRIQLASTRFYLGLFGWLLVVCQFSRAWGKFLTKMEKAHSGKSLEHFLSKVLSKKSSSQNAFLQSWLEKKISSKTNTVDSCSNGSAFNKNPFLTTFFCPLQLFLLLSYNGYSNISL